MKLVNGLVGMLLSLVVLTLGIGYAQLTDEITATGELNYVHTTLYISNMTPDAGVSVAGYSGTLINLNVTDAEKTIQIRITNPTPNAYYYLNHTSSNENFTLSENLVLGAAIAASGGTIEFTVTFKEAGDYSIQFIFTLVPPAIEDDDGFLSSTNATALIDFAIDNMDYGLNADVDKHAFAFWCTESKRVLFCLDSSVSGTNLGKEYDNLGATNIYYTLEWVNERTYHLYLYYSADAVAKNLDTYIDVYKQTIVYNNTTEKWIAGDSAKGYSKVVKFGNKSYQIEVGTLNGNDYVVWYETKPAS
ncbi:MAG: hypothetical protein IJW11_07425 [Clostridia bacterium]|nr:hypothetical protein [Clostridia bacterium]MBQ7407565.1 hypothetical protein [Clostridia bacterium]